MRRSQPIGLVFPHKIKRLIQITWKKALKWFSLVFSWEYRHFIWPPKIIILIRAKCCFEPASVKIHGQKWTGKSLQLQISHKHCITSEILLLSFQNTFAFGRLQWSWKDRQIAIGTKMWCQCERFGKCF